MTIVHVPPLMNKPWFINLQLTLNVPNPIANLRYPAKSYKFFAGERRYSHRYQKTKGLKYPCKIDLDPL